MVSDLPILFRIDGWQIWKSSLKIQLSRHGHIYGRGNFQISTRNLVPRPKSSCSADNVKDYKNGLRFATILLHTFAQIFLANTNYVQLRGDWLKK